MVCARDNVHSQPVVRLYSATKRFYEGRDTSDLDDTSLFERRVVAEWQGAPIATEIVNWFKVIQAQGQISPAAKWPSNDEVRTHSEKNLCHLTLSEPIPFAFCRVTHRDLVCTNFAC